MAGLSGGDDTQILRIAGHGDEVTGRQFTLADRVPPAAWSPPAGTTDPHVVIASAPVAIKAEIRPLAPIGQIGGLEIELALDDASAAVRSLLRDRRNVEPVAYLTRFASADDTTWTVSDASAFTVGQYVHAGRECVLVTDLPGGGAIEVQRGAMGTTAVDHSVGLLGVPITAVPVSYRGAWVTLSRISGAAGSEEVRYRGVLQRVTRKDGLRVVLTVDSLLATISERAWSMPYVDGESVPRADIPYTRGVLEPRIDSWDRELLVDAEQWGPDASHRWELAAWIAEDRYVVLPVTYQETTDRTSTGPLARRVARYSLPEGSLASWVVGTGTTRELLTFDRSTEDGAAAWIGFVRDTIAEAERVEFVPEVFAIEDLIARSLTGFGPWSAGVGLPAAFLDPDGLGWPFVVNRALPRSVNNADAAAGTGVLGYLPPGAESTKKHLEAVLRPLFLGLTARSGGRLGVIDWGADERERGGVVDLAELATTLQHSIVEDAADAVPIVAAVRNRKHTRGRVEADGRGGPTTVIDVSRDLVVSTRVTTDAVLLAPRELEAGPLYSAAADDAAHRARLAQIVDVWGAPPARLEMELAEYRTILATDAWEIGDARRATHPHWTDGTGQITGDAVARLLITQRVTDDADRTETVHALILGYVAGEPDPPTWSPWGRVVSATTTWTTIETDAFTDPDAGEGPTTDAAAFAFVTAKGYTVEHLDGDDCTRVAQSTCTAVDVAGSRLAIKWTTPPVAGDYVRLGGYDAAGIGEILAAGFDGDGPGGPPAFLADPSGRLGTDDDPGQRYS